MEGKVLAAAVHKSHTTPEGLAYRRMKYVVECRVPGEAVQRLELKETERFGSKVMRSLNKGETVPLLVDRSSGKIRFDVDDPQINLKVWIKKVKQREDSNFKKALGD
ncbi:MAG: hypothetical protein ABIP03_09000 [Aquihabitans sp.]